MKVVFYGTPEYSVGILEALASRHRVIAVVTKPDRPRGRGMKLLPSPVKLTAEKLSIPVLQPERASSAESRRRLRELAPELCVLASYGQILSCRLLAVPPYGFINVHPSLLPKYRGASPIQSAILDGAEETGVSIIQMNERMDEGPILAQRSIRLGTETAKGLSEKLSALGAELLLEVIEEIEKGTVNPRPQDNSLATYTPLIQKSDGLLDWTERAIDLERRVRAMQPSPGAFAFAKLDNGTELRLNITSAEVADLDGSPGEILTREEELVVACGEGALRILTLKPAGGKELSAVDFLCGRGRNLSTHFLVRS